MVPKASLAKHEPTGLIPTPKTRRSVWFAADAALDTPVYDRETLPAGFVFKGPAIVEQLDSTVVVPPGTTAEVDTYLNIIIRIEGEANV
ncbi:Acetophenone carboxylase gamma subunit [compost metagenome]